MIQSLDTYLYKEIEERLPIILNECYIIDEALKGLDSEAQKAFKDTYCGENAKEIKVSYEFPQSKEAFDARYVISLGGSQETAKSIGGIQGTFTFREDGVEKEVVPLVRDGDRLIFKTSKKVGEFLNSTNITFSVSDDFKVEDGVASFNYEYNEDLEGAEFDVSYQSLATDDKVQGYHKGYQAVETVGVVGISNNMDIARCLDAIWKLILITLRDNMEEKNDLMLQTVEFADMQPVIQDGETLVFGRPCTLSYEINNTVSFDVVDGVKKFVYRKRGGKV